MSNFKDTLQVIIIHFFFILAYLFISAIVGLFVYIMFIMHHTLSITLAIIVLIGYILMSTYYIIEFKEAMYD